MKPRGAYDGWYTELEITLVGASSATVVLDDLRVKTVSRREPTGIALNCLVGGADITPRSLVVDLDFEPGVVTYEDDGGEPAGAFSFSLVKGEVERFHVRASTSARVEWTAELLLLVDGRRQTIALTDNGQPFRTIWPEGPASLAMDAG
jgi:hypothetical protein